MYKFFIIISPKPSYECHYVHLMSVFFMTMQQRFFSERLHVESSHLSHTACSSLTHRTISTESEGAGSSVQKSSIGMRREAIEMHRNRALPPSGLQRVPMVIAKAHRPATGWYLWRSRRLARGKNRLQKTEHLRGNLHTHTQTYIFSFFPLYLRQ